MPDTEAWQQLIRWQQTVEQRLEDGDKRMLALEQEGVRRTKLLEENTRLTQGVAESVSTVDGKVEALRTKLDASVFPIVDGVDSGLRVIGSLGKVAEWFARRWKWIVVCAISAKVALNGGSFTEAWNQIMHALEVEK